MCYLSGGNGFGARAFGNTDDFYQLFVLWVNVFKMLDKKKFSKLI